MAVTFMTGFEARQAASDGSGSGVLSGTSSYNTNATYVRTGAASLRANPASGASGFINLGLVALTSGYFHFAFYVASAPSVDRTILGGTTAKHLVLTSTGTIAYYDSGVLRGTTTATVGTGGWHWIGMRVTTGTSVVAIKIDGADALTASPDNTNALQVYLGCSGGELSAIDLYYDDVIIDGAGFIAASKVDTALPIACTAGGATDGNGGTTNIWEGINNTPPVGVASADEAANPNSCIRFPASTVVTFVATLETYSTLGLVSGDTLLAVQSLIRHGEDIASGAKNGTLGAVTNPTISDSLAFTFGDDGGAHGAETGNWKMKFGTMTASPSVTLGTSPTITVSRASETRVGCIDLMGLLVAWTPASAKSPPFKPRHRCLIVR